LGLYEGGEAGTNTAQPRTKPPPNDK
jgi:hypothetical protein